MSKGVKICAVLAAIIFIVSVVLAIYLYRAPESCMVEVVRDTEVLYTFDLSEAEDQTVKIEYPDGGYNIIEIMDGSIRISDADCPDLTCVKTGALRAESIPIVCLPHHVIVRYVD